VANARPNIGKLRLGSFKLRGNNGEADGTNGSTYELAQPPDNVL